VADALNFDVEGTFQNFVPFHFTHFIQLKIL
jgi:hypothetical protein